MCLKNCKYPVLSRLINDRGIRKSVIAQHLGICPKALLLKTRGVTGFLFEEARAIHDYFFPDIALEHLFSVEASGQTAQGDR